MPPPSSPRTTSTMIMTSSRRPHVREGRCCEEVQQGDVEGAYQICCVPRTNPSGSTRFGRSIESTTTPASSKRGYLARIANQLLRPCRVQRCPHRWVAQLLLLSPPRSTQLQEEEDIVANMFPDADAMVGTDRRPRRSGMGGSFNSASSSAPARPRDRLWSQPPLPPPTSERRERGKRFCGWGTMKFRCL
jgi:hypothetical protein